MNNRVETFSSPESFLHCKTFLLANNVVSKLKRMPPVQVHVRVQIFQELFGCHVDLQVRSDVDGLVVSQENFTIQDYSSYKRFKIQILKVLKDMEAKAVTSLESE